MHDCCGQGFLAHVCIEGTESEEVEKKGGDTKIISSIIFKLAVLQAPLAFITGISYKNILSVEHFPDFLI